MVDTDRLIADFTNASKAVAKMPTGRTANGPEKVYGQTYQALVRARLKPQIRRKYR